MENTDQASRRQGRSMNWNQFRTPCRTGRALALNRLRPRVALTLVLAIGFCLLAGSQALAVPGLISEAYSNNNSTSIEIAGGDHRILIVSVDEEYDFGVSSVTLDGQPLTLVHEYEEPFGVGNSTSIWIMLDDNLPSDDTYTVTTSGGNGRASVAAMLWSGLLQNIPSGSEIGAAGQVGGNQITTSVEAPAPNSLVVGTSGHGNANGWAAAPSGWTRPWDLTPSSAFHAGATTIAASAGEISLTETCGGGDFNRAAQVVAAFAPVPEPNPPPGCPDCAYRRPISIAPANLGASCAADVTAFPVLVTIEKNANNAAALSLRNKDNGGHVKTAGGYDIAFTNAAGAPLYHEVESYDPAQGTLVAWVKVPALSTSADTMIYLVYGDSAVGTPTERPGAVWDYKYKGVWHLNQAPANGPAEILDSTAYSNHGKSKSMEAGDRTAGRIGDGLDFDGIDDYVRIGDALDGASQLTISAWIHHDGIPANIERYVSVANIATIRHAGNGTLQFFVRTNGVSRHITVNNALTVGAWYYVVGTWDGTTQILYKNGVQLGSQVPGGNLDPTGNVSISTSAEPMDGIIDEVRISSKPRDACRIETEYINQSNPAAFHTVGDEEETGVTVTTYTITATADANGSIFPAGAVIVDEGDSKTFLLAADENYEIDTVAIDGGPAQSWSSVQYQFTDITADTSIAVTFKVAAVGPPPVDDVLPPGCSENIAVEYTGGFDPTKLDLLNVQVNADGYVKLNTGHQAIDTENIVLSFRQEVTVSFLHEGGNNTETDFGWMLAGEDPYGIPDPHRIIYEDMNDNDKNGVLDVDGDDTTDRFGDRNGDGRIDALDNREVLGTFDAGTELVFFIKVDEGQGYRNNMSNPVTGVKVTDFVQQNEQVYHYTKTAWNGSRFTSRETLSSPELSCDRAWGDPFTKIYNLGLADSVTACSQGDGWMDAEGLARAADPFGLNFDVDDTASLSVVWDERWPAVMVGAPADEPNAWVLGFEDLVGGGDMDNNDLIFILERETGGTASLQPAAAISPTDADTNISAVTIGVWDEMPDGTCTGRTEIIYWLSIDAGANWVEVDGWDAVYNFTLAGGQKILGGPVTNWIPGTPALTYRTRRLDFTGLGLSGHELIWRAELKSRKEGCEPEIIDMSLNLSVGEAGHIARSTPTVLANVLYSGSMETPAWNWALAELRGHLKSTRIYDPADPSQTASLALWDAGDVLKNQMEPSQRLIYIPDVTVHAVDSGTAEALATGDGVTTTFSGRLAHYPVLATTVRISDARETFSDRHTDQLDGDRGGSGWINRFTGHYRLTFDTPPNLDQPITAAYSYFTFNPGGNLREFKENLVAAAELGLDDSTVVPTGLVYDFNNDDAFSLLDSNWLINWTRGYSDGNDKLVEKEWILGALDHSVPAVATPPASSPWFYGTAFPEDKLDSTQDRKGYREFTAAHAARRAVVYVGARDGMLHAFDTGVFRWDDNPCTGVGENRGYFQWKDPSDADPDACYTSCSADCQPDYGSGEELWAFIPTNLLPRLKNNYLQGDDKAYVDASPALADVHTDGAWRTVLLSAQGNGGDTIFCLDVTNPYAPKFMWEFADPELFRSRSSPAVAQIGRILYQNTTKWVAFFVSGKTFDDTLYPSIYAIDIADGSLVEKIDLDAEPAGAGGILSGQPTIVDSDGNGYVDRLYIGSDKGRLYKINIPDDPDSAKYRIGHCVVNTDFSDRDDNVVPDNWHYQPIYGSPTVVSSNSVDLTGKMTYDIRVFFGTGDSPYYDEDINFAETRYLFYAYRDTAAKGQCETGQVALDWFFELPEGHRIYASAFAAAGNIYFGTSTGDTEDPCDINANKDAAFDALAGKLYAFDLDNPTGLPALERTVGNVLAAPVVEDEHIYVQTVSGDVDSFGSGEYNTSTRQGGIPQIEIHWWREVF